MDIRVPRLAEGVETATVASVLVTVGDRIEKDQTILELETEKAVGPIPSPVGGMVARIHVKEGEEVSVGQVLITLSEQEKGEGTAPEKEKGKTGSHEEEQEAPRADEDEDREHPAETRGRQKEPAEDYRYESESGFPPPASPSIRKLARQLGIDLTRVRGSEAGGRITLRDVRVHIQHLQETAFGKPPPAGPRKPAPEAIDFSRWGPVNKKRVSSLRRTVARRMRESWTTVPHITQFDEADITSLMEHKKSHGPAYEKKGARLTFTVFALKAAVEALKKHPAFNASLDEAAEEMVYKEYYHIGVAVDTDNGLVVPVIRDVDQKGLLDLARELNGVVRKTRDRTVAVEELQGGTFTISNQGGVGSAHFTPIIYKPQVAILGLGQAAWKPVLQGDTVTPRLMVPVSLSYDHRVIDGADAVRFIRDIVMALENFSEEEIKP